VLGNAVSRRLAPPLRNHLSLNSQDQRKPTFRYTIREAYVVMQRVIPRRQQQYMAAAGATLQHDTTNGQTGSTTAADRRPTNEVSACNALDNCVTLTFDLLTPFS